MSLFMLHFCSRKLYGNWMCLIQVLCLPEDVDLSPKHVRNVRCTNYDCRNIVITVCLCG